MRRSHVRFSAMAVFLTLGCLLSSGCARYCSNRLHDFCDIFQAGAGITCENPGSGVIPPALGLHVQATEFLNLGAVHFTGNTAEMDGRGFFAGAESRTRLGFGPLQAVRVDQDYDGGHANYYKAPETPWANRMSSRNMLWGKKPAKSLTYQYWANNMHMGAPLMHRGWQYWENLNVELALCEPFVTHLGFSLRLGFDPSEISDFIGGIFCIDFKRDDLTSEEYRAKTRPSAAVSGSE